MSYPSLTEGETYRDTASGDLAEITDAPETFGRPTHELDTETVEIEWEDGTWATVYLDHFAGTNPRFVPADN